MPDVFNRRFVQSLDVGSSPTFAGLTVGGYYHVAGYGIAADGTDQTDAIQDLLDLVYTNGGGTIVFGEGTYRIDGALTLPHNGATGSAPAGKAMRLVGSGAFATGKTGELAPSGGTILDMRASAATGKLDCRGTGSLEITGITLSSANASASGPFIFTTNTSLWVHHCGFYGRQGTPANCDEDAIVCGGANTDGTIDESGSSPFQGYGTVIADNWFQRVRRGVYGRTFANGIVFKNNCFWNGCGGTAAVEFQSYHSGGETCTGNQVICNLVEMVGYTYFAKLTKATTNFFIGNSFYDPGAGVTAYYRFESDALYTLVIDGYHSDSKTWVSDASGGNYTRITSHQGETNVSANKASFTYHGEQGIVFSNASGYGPQVANTTWNKSHYFKQENNNLDLYFRFDAATLMHFMSWAYTGGNNVKVSFGAKAATAGTISNDGGGDMNLQVNSGKTLRLGTTGNLLALSVPATLASAGSGQSDAAAVAQIVTIATGADGAKGVKLPTAVAGLAFFVRNASASNLLVYPNTDDEINEGGANNAITMSGNTGKWFLALDGTDWYTD